MASSDNNALLAFFLNEVQTAQHERRSAPDLKKTRTGRISQALGVSGVIGRDDMTDSTTKIDAGLLRRLDRFSREHRTARTAPPGRQEDGAEADGTKRSAATLSTAHISPQICYYDGASLFKASKGGECDQVGGGVRGKIKGFSQASRLRLMRTIAKVRRDAELPCFVTLTYPDEFPSPVESKVHLDNFIRRVNRRFPQAGLIWKLEPQKRGAPHYHLLVWGVDLGDLMIFVPQAWFEIAGGGDPKHLAWHWGQCGHGNKHCVQKVQSFKGVWYYAAKYLGKTFEVAGWNEKWTGRYWGVIAPANIPFGELRELVITRQQAITAMRYQRRFTRTRKVKGKKIYRPRGDRRSLTIFCDATQWAERLFPLND